MQNLPALNAWSIFFQGHGITLYSRNAATVPGTNNSDYIYLKSYPEIFEMERKLFAEWFTTTPTGIYLQQQHSNAQSWQLVYINYKDVQLTIVKTDIHTTGWSSGYEDGKPILVIKGEANIVLG
ncbi:hypothetical protein Q765_14990 [Flavobacterium rivuli WB 3.3-2 = DSM 21788]|uniref:Uncharacterized protein n=1 Tax=Flavobacterium rivuli WB 3.3-2 = DSM 21788 TaxID=1121895 RepID=A0A0A2LZE6_9FLAO|nr:hypothetical protein [Flavobacterium rivuli]KGO85722.1 hypothetical protein Q765_14990 [Flavobacterium rivuli WB 3.3-2 = DSM 21788]